MRCAESANDAEVGIGALRCDSWSWCLEEEAKFGCDWQVMICVAALLAYSLLVLPLVE